MTEGKIKKILEEKILPYLKFTKEIAKYLESKNYKERKDYTLFTDEDIFDKFYKLNDNWISFYYLNLKEDNPKEIA